MTAPHRSVSWKLKRKPHRLVGTFVLVILLIAGLTASSAQAHTFGADLSITETDSPDPVANGDQLTYTIVVRNNGPTRALHVKVTDPQQVEASFRSASANQGSCVFGLPEAIVCDLGTLPAGGHAVVTIKYIAFSGPTTYTNCVSVSAATTDPNLANNLACSTTTVLA
jgi:uncharacterized repeat protein (TIGR01451 family)